MPRTIYVDLKKLNLSRKEFVEMLKKDPKAAEILNTEKKEYDKLTKKLKEDK